MKTAQQRARCSWSNIQLCGLQKHIEPVERHIHGGVRDRTNYAAAVMTLEGQILMRTGKLSVPGGPYTRNWVHYWYQQQQKATDGIHRVGFDTGHMKAMLSSTHKSSVRSSHVRNDPQFSHATPLTNVRAHIARQPHI